MENKTYERIKSIIDDAMEKLSNLDREYDGHFFTVNDRIVYFERRDRIKAEAFDKIIGKG